MASYSSPNMPCKYLMVLALVLCSAGRSVFAQSRFYEVLPDSAEQKLLRGLVNMQDIQNDTAFKWYAENLRYYRPNAGLVTAMKQKTGQFTLMIFMGTWCHDSQQIVPKYFSCVQAASIPASDITILATDRNKTTIGNLHRQFGVSLVPTVIVLKNGKEAGRIEEYGKTGLPDAELAEIIQNL